MAVYFIAGAGKTKIGSSKKPHERFRSLQLANAADLTMLRVIDGNWYTEAVLQRSFSDRHSHGEWFHGVFTDIDIDQAERLAMNHQRSPSRVQLGRGQRSHINKVTPPWTKEQWARHDERVVALNAVYETDPVAREIKVSIHNAETLEEVNDAASRAETWFVSRS